MARPLSSLTRIRPADESKWPESLSDPARVLLEYWVSKCEHGAFPDRAGIEPRDLQRILPYIYIVERLDGQKSDYIFRLVGTHIVNIEGECTGKRLSSIFPDRGRYANLWKHYDEACRGVTYIRRENLGWREKEFIEYEVVLLPLCGDDQTVRYLIGTAHGKPLRGDRASGEVVRFVRPVLDFPKVSLGSDGVFIVDYRSDRLAISPARMRFSEQKILEMSEGNPVPVAILAESISGFGQEPLEGATVPERRKAVLASAIVAKSTAGRKIAEAFLASRPSPYPIQTFGSMEDAKTWLYTFM